MALMRLLGRRRRGRRYRADDDYQEGYEDVYYYTSKYNTHLLSESHRATLREREREREKEREAFFYCLAGRARAAYHQITAFMASVSVCESRLHITHTYTQAGIQMQEGQVVCG